MDRRPKRSAAAAPLPPDDALVEILSLVPAKSLCRFKCVSKAWRDLIADRLRCKKLPQTLEGFFFFDYSDDDGGCKEDGGGGASSDRVLRGHFMNTLGRSVPLASFSFLVDQPGVEFICLVHACNGLLLFGHKRVPGSDTHYSLGYIVCNPATGHWVAVPSSGCKPFSLSDGGEEDSDNDTESGCPFTYLVFDPAVSSHFQLVEFWMYNAAVEEVHTYSSETGVWCEAESEWSSDETISFFADTAFVNGRLHFSVTSSDSSSGTHQELIVAVDGEGNNCRTIRGPEKQCDVAFVGQSQGCLHYMSHHRDTDTGEMTELSIWALQDYDKEDWVLKHSVTFKKLFGKTICQGKDDYNVVAIHPDHNLIFFLQHWDLKLKSYDMDSKEVCTLRTLGVGPQNIVPYVPYFAESSALASKH